MFSKSLCKTKKYVPATMSTSWDLLAFDYHKLVQTQGHYYHRKVILPQLLPLLSLTSEASLLDIGCGQGVLERAIPKTCRYLGCDISSSLITIANKIRKSRAHNFIVQDFSLPLHMEKMNSPPFSHAVAILSLQNMRFPDHAIQNTAALLQPSGQFFIVLNHPCFRIPRISSWHYDESKKLVARQINRYLSSITIPIKTHPGKENSSYSHSFHFPLTYWVQALSSSGFVIQGLQEWISPKTSTGKRAKAENLCRKEFPLFLMISCIKMK
ncbi:class I SAM-dependent methyltransferase [Candidatus Chlamydia sanziniae]|uniref:3-demethylubiquinone-9 3-methyltransferase n=1 Tax=Candidatus Chlamydia sanziniae TaxID=1806891 RepID=A0A1A9HY46_9CHLA|nr:class I SAM-dependent methyltransferase [Candidatus Chlamydia sanziniae]ANH78964.1 3-demethylubiquinone-9 3-methyltransferase [Candidatus Chlamydia sanziniae]